MSFLQTPLYLSSLTVLFNLPPSVALPQQSSTHQGASGSSPCTPSLDAVKTAVHRAVVGRCMLVLSFHIVTCMFCLVLSLQQVHQVSALCAGRTEGVSTALQSPFRRSSPDVHWLPMPPHLQALGLVPLDDKSASGANVIAVCKWPAFQGVVPSPLVQVFCLGSEVLSMGAGLLPIHFHVLAVLLLVFTK